MKSVAVLLPRAHFIFRGRQHGCAGVSETAQQMTGSMINLVLQERADRRQTTGGHLLAAHDEKSNSNTFRFAQSLLAAGPLSPVCRCCGID